MNDQDLVRWAAGAAGWHIGRAPMAHLVWPPNSFCRVDVEDPFDDLAALNALAFDLLQRYVKATPEPFVHVGDNDKSMQEWYDWVGQIVRVNKAIAESPLATIRAIYDTKVLNER